ncbi:MAG: sensor protein KdpD, partial [Caldilineaceae bacterium]
MTVDRPDPEALLAAVQKLEASASRGRLKIYFGMAAGVGKTFAMLSDARQALAEGVDLVVGVVETHGRAETEALLAGLEVIPRRAVEHRGVTLYEMDIEAIRARRPQVVLVDELAHTNAPGSRHAKRHQDVVELLEAGCDVWTTVNVQHFESRADAVAQITGIRVHETVPDTLLELADEIELIDLSPEELRKRLAEGKVYTPDRSEVASQSFFRVGNLTALREMALRLTAEHVDHQLQDYMQIKRIAGPWKSGERLMVAVGPAPHTERLIRWTRRMAYNLEAPWLAVHIETTRALPTDQQDALARHLTLARSLGAEVVTTSSEDVVEGLLRVARQRNVSQIVAGKPVHPWWQTLLGGGSLVDRLLRQAGEIDIYVVSSDAPGTATSARFQVEQAFHSSWRDYGMALALVIAVTLINLLAYPWITYLGVGLTELLA